MDRKFFNLQLFAKVNGETLTADNDYITNQNSNVIIYALAGNDRISSMVTKNVTIFGGKGNDTLSNNFGEKNIYLSGDAGNDYLAGGQTQN